MLFPTSCSHGPIFGPLKYGIISFRSLWVVDRNEKTATMEIFIFEPRAPSRTFRKGTKLEIPAAHARLPQLVACSVAWPYAPTYPAGHPYLPRRAPSVRADLPCWAPVLTPPCPSVRADLPCWAHMYVPRCALSVRADLPYDYHYKTMSPDRKLSDFI